MRRTPRSTVSRRAFLRGAGAAGAGALLAGCTGNRTGDSGETEGTTGSGATAETTAGDATTTGEASGPYSVSMSPVGTVEFENVPERVFTVFPQYADMAVALGHGEKVNSVYVPKMSGTTMNHYYHHLDGVSFDWKGLRDPLTDGLPKELLYELNSDVHLADPAWASTQKNWDRSDVEEITSQIAPWFGNFYSGTRAAAPDGYKNYQHYTLWDLFGNVAKVFREEAKYRALAKVHSNLVSSIQEKLPPKEERPTAVRVTLAQDGKSFYTYHLNKPGYWLADTRPLGANDAFADQNWKNLWGTVDYETMLEADPDVILHLWGMTPNYDMAETRKKLENHASGSQLTAVKNDRVYAAGMRYQGPIMNLFQIEMGAKQLYPDLFGEWPRYEDGDHYPEIPEKEWLFDRNEVAKIVTGNGA
ncbi:MULTISPECIES: ABC transporter substrate-binding protein [Halorussus]|uniref:ABC transporter substrate-binding protein n=1 Tax=Halorussus TaxID=1070314 RepID=UPI0020A018A4|nr:ABC transporter substrate-binding protein [Halorussus vallis]USZ74128.1 ABC transporter substrate-binding protein [Halorussus vallis]